MSMRVGESKDPFITVTQKDTVEILKKFLELPENELEKLLELSEEEILKKLNLTEKELEPFDKLSDQELSEKLGITPEHAKKFLRIKFKKHNIIQVTPLYQSPMDQAINRLITGK